MAITPKFQIGKKERRTFATKEFTDRELPRTVFKNAISIFESQDFEDKDKTRNVIVFYGVGGVGKSSLRKQLQIDLFKHNPSALYSYVDFIEPTYRNPPRALLELQKNIKSKDNVRLIHFELAYAVFFKKKNPDISYKERNLPYEEEASIAGDLIGALDGLGVFGAVTGIVKKAYKMLSKYGLEVEVKEDLEELETLAIHEIEDRLPAFFAYDIRKILAKKEVPLVVMFLDTYEALWANNRTEASLFTSDAWVREFIAQLPQVLFVICGRERVRWEELDLDWGHHLDQHLLDNLGYKDADSFLQSCGIQEPEIRKKIITASGGHPYHLDLSVDIYYELANKKVKITSSSFASSKREILDRFIRYLDTSEIETLKSLAVGRYYNYELFEYLVHNLNTGYPLTKFPDLNRFSFISEDKGNYYIHSLMREGLTRVQARYLNSALNKLYAAFYENKLDIARSQHNHEQLVSCLSEALYHLRNHLSKKQFISWLSGQKLQVLKYLQLMGEATYLERLLTDIAEWLGIQNIGIKLFSILVDMVHLTGGYSKAVGMIDEYLLSATMNEISKSDELLHLYIRKIHHQMFYKPVNPLIKQLVSIEKTVDPKLFPERYNEVLFMLGGNLGVLSGDFKFSRKWLIRSIRFALQHSFHDFLCRTLRKYSDILRQCGHIKFSAKICEWGITVARHHDFKRYELYLICTKGEIAREQGDNGLAINIYREAERLAKQQGISGWVAHVYLACGEYYLHQHEFPTALNYFFKADEIYKEIGQIWGRMQVAFGVTRYYMLEGNNRWIAMANTGVRNARKMGYRKEEALFSELLSSQAFINNKLMFL